MNRLDVVVVAFFVLRGEDGGDRRLSGLLELKVLIERRNLEKVVTRSLKARLHRAALGFEQLLNDIGGELGKQEAAVIEFRRVNINLL